MLALRALRLAANRGVALFKCGSIISLFPFQLNVTKSYRSSTPPIAVFQGSIHGPLQHFLPFVPSCML